MLRRSFLLLKSFAILILLINNLNSFGQEKGKKTKVLGSLLMFEAKNCTVDGNIKQLALTGALVDSFAFQYTNAVTGEPVTIPVNKDTAGNFKVIFPISGYQQLTLSQGVKVNDQIQFGGMTQFSFYVGNGGTTTFHFYVSENYEKRVLKFAGNFANLNNEHLSYQGKLNSSGLSQLIDYKIFDSLDPAGYIGYKTYIAERLKLGLEFNSNYFKQVKADPLLKIMVDEDMRYTAGNMLVQGLLKTKVSDPQLLDFFNDNMILLHNPQASGNENYCAFLDQYYRVLKQEVNKKSSEILITSPAMASYLLKEHADLSAEDKAFALQIQDTTINLSSEEHSRFVDQLLHPYAEEYITTIETGAMFDDLMLNEDPFLRDLYLTKLLTIRVNHHQIASARPFIAAYKSNVRSSRLKTSFLKTYQDEYNKVYNSKLTTRMVLNSSKELDVAAPLKTITEKYKGKVIYVDIWATWCAPCIAEMGNAKILRDKLTAKGVVFVYLCMQSQKENVWKNLIAANDIEGEHYFLNVGQSAVLGKEFSINAIPRYMLINQEGSIVNPTSGRPGDPNTLEEIRGLLKLSVR